MLVIADMLLRARARVHTVRQDALTSTAPVSPMRRQYSKSASCLVMTSAAVSGDGFSDQSELAPGVL